MSTERHDPDRVLHLDPAGPLVSTSDDTSDLIGDAWANARDTVAVPVARLDPRFFDLASGFAGAVAQKFVNYRIRLAVVGDVTAYESASRAFRDWVRESNRGDHVWFVADEAALAERLRG
ncbi:DUF4180 domain-containing protein [Agromyces intestinalis]|uniref:DUF4180 domain-containing protein n=1 Tax=Agromyces intestinalis TaxID=2592652 RepID=A0A5C1YH21_9MICO|nr:DUF4180 domain-containing protein [Agromyces intestinalis]QEO15516.1 DUF4180 domain-containing protein [Agromyces intestinalis]